MTAGGNNTQEPKAKKRRIALLSTEVCRDLLLPHEVIRDPVHEDIYVTALERAIIDTASFQRLRKLKQLGSTELVYPGAVHNRFLHSIGTLYTAQMIVDVVNRNCSVYPEGQLIPVDEYARLLIRLCALLHDLAHIPYGHALEDEGNLTNGIAEWSDKARAALWMGKDSDVAKVITPFLVAAGVDEVGAQAVMDDVRRYLLHEKADVSELEYPYIVDIIGNTLCADLLDYLERDMFFCGLRERTGDRAIKYLSILRLKRTSREDEEEEYSVLDKDTKDAVRRVVLLAYRLERQHEPQGSFQVVKKPDVLSEAIDLLRRRFTLAEKVYFHRTKTAAAAMLISSMAESGFQLRDIYELTDEEFVQKLADVENHPRAKNLARQYQQRNLYKASYYIAYREESEGDPQSRRRDLYEKYRKSAERSRLEAQLEDLYGLPAGSVVVYCPEKEMNIKQFDMLVQSRPQGEVKKLRNILDQSRLAEMDAVNARFAQLWRLQVFVDPNLVRPDSDDAANFAKVCEYLIGFENSNDVVRGRGRPARQQFARAARARYCTETGIPEKEITVEELDALVDIAAERSPEDGTNMVEGMYEQLRILRHDRDRTRLHARGKGSSESLPLEEQQQLRP